MRILHITHLAHMAVIVGQLFYSVATGEDIPARQIQTTPGAQQKNQQPQQQLTDYFAGSLMLMNEGTIEMSEMAAEKSSTEEIKKFAQMLAKGHRQLNDELQEIAPLIAQRLGINSGSNSHSAAFRGGQRSEQVAQGDYLLDKVLIVQKEAADNYQQSSNEMIDRYEGQDFDMAFLGMQIGAHTWALAELKAMESVGSPEFQQIVTKSKSEVQQHLEEAQRLSKKFEDDE